MCNILQEPCKQPMLIHFFDKKIKLQPSSVKKN